MSFFSGLLADLKEKRLWPVALALVVALVAIPVVLSDPAKESPEPSAPAVAGSALLGKDSAALLGETKPIVSLRGEGGFRKRIARLAKKNPFIQQARPQSKGSGESLTIGGGATGAEGVAPTGGVPGSEGSTPAPDSSQPTKLFQYVAKVKFGRISQTKSQTVEPADFMPSEQNPVLLFLGAANGGKDVLFLVSPEAATARGDGTCVPSESDCQIVRLKKGDVEFFEVALSAETVVTYELEIVEIELDEVTGESSTQERNLRLHRLSTSRLRSMRQAMRTRRVFKALDQLGF